MRGLSLTLQQKEKKYAWRGGMSYYWLAGWLAGWLAASVACALELNKAVANKSNVFGLIKIIEYPYY